MVLHRTGNYLSVTPGCKDNLPPGRILMSLVTVYSPARRFSTPSTSPPIIAVPSTWNCGTNDGYFIIVVVPGLLVCSRYGKYSIFARL